MDLNSKKIIWKEWADGMKIADDSLKKFLQSEEYGEKTIENFTLFLKKQNGGLKGFGNTLKSVAKSLTSFGLNLAIDAGIALIMSGVNELMSMETDAAERAQEMAEKAGEAYDEVKKNMNELDDLIKQYNNLQISNDVLFVGASSTISSCATCTRSIRHRSDLFGARLV